MSKQIPKSPSISPSSALRADINSLIARGVTIHGANRGCPAGASPRINQIYARFDLMRREMAIPLNQTEQMILIECLNGSVVDFSFIEGLEHEIADSDGATSNPKAALSLQEKMRNASMAARIATIDLLGY